VLGPEMLWAEEEGAWSPLEEVEMVEDPGRVRVKAELLGVVLLE